MPRQAQVELEFVSLHYAAEGADDADLILFLHGFPEFWYQWKNQLAEFGRTHLAVAPDLRGYNLSSKPPNIEDFTMPNLVEDVRGLAAHFGYGGGNKFTLVAHDWGGVIAWAFALAHPGWLARLVVINAPHPAVFFRELATNPAQQKASEYMQFLRSPIAETALAADNFAPLAQLFLADGFRRGFFNEADHAAYVEAWSQPGALTGALNYYRAAPFHAVNDDLPEASGLIPGASSWIVNVPTLVLWGMKDTYLLPANLDGLEEYVPILHVERIPNGSHWVIHEMPETVNRHIHDFVDSA